MERKWINPVPQGTQVSEGRKPDEVHRRLHVRGRTLHGLQGQR